MPTIGHQCTVGVLAGNHRCDDSSRQDDESPKRQPYSAVLHWGSAALHWAEAVLHSLIAHLTCSLATLPNLTNAVYSSYDASKLHQIETWLDVTCMAGKLNWSWHAPSAMRVHFCIHNRTAEVFSRSSTRSLRPVSVLLLLLVLWGSRASWFASSPVSWLPSPCWC